MDVVSFVERRSQVVIKRSVCVGRNEEVDAVNGWRLGCEVFVDGGDLVMKEVRQRVAEFLLGGDDVSSGCGIGEFLHYGEEFFAVAGTIL